MQWSARRQLPRPSAREQSLVRTPAWQRLVLPLVHSQPRMQPGHLPQPLRSQFRAGPGDCDLTRWEYLSPPTGFRPCGLVRANSSIPSWPHVTNQNRQHDCIRHEAPRGIGVIVVLLALWVKSNHWLRACGVVPADVRGMFTVLPTVYRVPPRHGRTR